MLDDPRGWGLAGGSMLAGLFGMLGRLLYLHTTARKPWSWALLYEVPVGYGMGLIGLGIAEWFNLGTHGAVACIVAAAIIGPAAMAKLIMSFIEKKLP